MTVILRQSTQIVVRIGPFVDVTDGFTPETGITLAAADEAEALRAGTATLDISGATWAAVTGADGWYDLTLSTTATNTVGELVIVVQDDSVCLPVYQRFQVIEEALYDGIFAASAAALSTLAGADIRTAVGLAGANLDTQLSTIDDFLDTEVAAILAAVDTEVAAIKTQTDKLTFTVANQVDANIQYVNDVLVTGDGGSGSEWGP